MIDGGGIGGGYICYLLEGLEENHCPWRRYQKQVWPRAVRGGVHMSTRRKTSRRLKTSTTCQRGCVRPRQLLLSRHAALGVERRPQRLRSKGFVVLRVHMLRRPRPRQLLATCYRRSKGFVGLRVHMRWRPRPRQLLLSRHAALGVERRPQRLRSKGFVVLRVHMLRHPRPRQLLLSRHTPAIVRGDVAPVRSVGVSQCKRRRSLVACCVQALPQTKRRPSQKLNTLMPTTRIHLKRRKNMRRH